jgi:hypothetical protein
MAEHEGDINDCRTPGKVFPGSRQFAAKHVWPSRLVVRQSLKGSPCQPECISHVRTEAPKPGGHRRLEGKSQSKMSGILVFPTLAAAVAAGFEIFERTADGYVVRARIAKGWALALVPLPAHHRP